MKFTCPKCKNMPNFDSNGKTICCNQVHNKIKPEVGKECVIESTDYFLVKHPDRVKQLGEVFTPTELVLDILLNLPDEVWEDGKTYLDPTCGNGQFLAAVLIIKQSLNHTTPLSTIYGVDIMQDNVDECRQRLIDIAGDTPANWKIVKHNILCKDGLTYDYSFGNSPAEQLGIGDATAPKKEKIIVENVGNNFDDIFG